FARPQQLLPLGASITGSMFPACYFASYRPPALSVRIFRSTTAPVSPEGVGFNASFPLQRLRTIPTVAPSISTPLRGFYPPQDQSVQSVRLPLSPPFGFTRFPLAPRCRSISSHGLGSSFQVRYVSEGLLFLKPLGTSFNMRLNHFSVNSL